MADPIPIAELLRLRAAIFRVADYGGVRGDKPLIIRQSPGLIALVDQLREERSALSQRARKAEAERDALIEERRNIRTALISALDRSDHKAALAEILAEMDTRALDGTEGS